VVLVSSLQLLAQDLYQGVVTLGLAIQTLESLSRLSVARILAQDSLVLLDRLLGVLLALRELGDLLGQLGLFGSFGHHALRALEHAEQPAFVTELLRVLAE